MRSVLRSAFLWRFAGGFALGALALLSFHPAHARRVMADTVASATHILR